MRKLRCIPLLFFALLAFFLWRGLSLDPHKIPSVQIGRALPAFSIPSLIGTEKTFSSATLRGHYYLLNVWASWCSACIEEQVFLLQLAREGIPLYGINYKDNPQKAKQWLEEWGNPFQRIGVDKKGLVAIDLGVYGAPETFLIDKRGVIVYRHVGVLDEASWKNEFLPRIPHEN